LAEKPQKPGNFALISLLCLSASVLAYEFFLMRILAMMVWAPFVNLIISLAMLGFGVSGSFMWFMRNVIKRHSITFLLIVTILFPVSAAVCFHISQTSDFNAYMILWDSHQYPRFLVMVIVFFIPFLAGATGMGSYFLIASGNSGRVYFFNLIGSAIGIILLAGSMFFLSPGRISMVIILLSGLSLLSLVISPESRKIRLAGTIFSILAIVIASAIFNGTEINISEYKALSTTMQTPGATIIAEKFHPIGHLQTVDAPSFHYMPGLSLNYDGYPPKQIPLFLDGDLLGAVDMIESLDQSKYLKYTPPALAYQYLDKPSVCIIGATGGNDVIQALMGNAEKIDVVEIHPGVREIVGKVTPENSINPYDSDKVRFITSSARNYLARSREKYDLIIFPSAGSSASTIAGMSALTENYTFTTESIESAIQHLEPDGFLYLSAWVRYPPKEGIKLIATVFEALASLKIRDPEEHIFAFRSWNMCSIIVSPTPMKSEFINSGRKFLEDNSFDAVYYDGITRDEVNRYNVQEDAPYYNASKMFVYETQHILYRDSLFNVKPADDNRPFFGNFLKWEKIPVLFNTMSMDWLPFIDWGQILTVLAFAHALIFGFILIFIPLISIRKKSIEQGHRSRLWTVIYFSSIGIAFFLLEIGFIQRLSLAFHHSVYSSFVVVTLFLVGASLGSREWNMNRFKGWQISPGFFNYILLLIICCYFILAYSSQYLLRLPTVVDFIISALLILFLSFFMGMAFPWGLDKLTTRGGNLVPWAWGVNAYASVLAGIVAPLIMQAGGFLMMILLALSFYGLAASSVGMVDEKIKHD
jgi:hypothetical protein